MLYNVVVSFCDAMLMVAKVTGMSQGIVIQEKSSIVNVHLLVLELSVNYFVLFSGNIL